MSKLISPAAPHQPNAAANAAAAASKYSSANQMTTQHTGGGGFAHQHARASSNQNGVSQGHPHHPQHIMNHQQHRRTMDTSSANHTIINASAAVAAAASNVMGTPSPLNGNNGKHATAAVVPHGLKRQAPNDSVDKPTPMKNSNGSAQKMNGGSKRSGDPMSGRSAAAICFYMYMFY